MRGDCKSPHEGSFLFPRTINLVTEASQIESPTSTQIGTSRPVTRMNGNSHHHHLRHQLNQRRRDACGACMAKAIPTTTHAHSEIDGLPAMVDGSRLGLALVAQPVAQ
ncbi:uncharacterized protein [Periplaneta americana]|uniref:uncharacterized protein n=1 Tax=Periplaneta americana TaxID=6978 RepID=UPI0037E88690